MLPKGKSGRIAIDVQTFTKMNNVLERARKAVCKLKPAHDDQGTGAFYEVNDHSNSVRFLFVTCNHVLPTNSLDEISKTILEFEEIENMTKINLDRKHIKYTWTSKLLDVTVIEISEEYSNLFKSYGAVFLRVGEAKAKAEFAMLQYPKGKFSIAHGEIDRISGADVFYHIGTAPGSSGSPLLDWNCVALAMHVAGENGSTSGNPEYWRKAKNLKATIEVYLTENSKDTIKSLECAENNL